MPSPEDAGLLQGLLEAVDAVAGELQTKWGVGRLELLVGVDSADLLARFRRQQATWSTTLQAAWQADPLPADLLAAAQAKAASMQRAWRALDAHAEEAGRRPIAPWVWEVPLAGGRVAALVQTEPEVALVKAGGRWVDVYTATDIGHLIDALPEAFGRPAPAPVRTEITNTLGAAPFDVAKGDDILFGGPKQEATR
jgi:hypothetical protein